MTFVYTENNVTGESRIDRINYTGNEQVGYQPYNSLRFYYETRLDKETSYIAGTKFQSSVLLRNIKAYNNNTVVKTYEFLYSFNIHSELSEIKEYGADMTPLNSTAICWGPTVNAITDNPSTLISIPGDKYYGDFNGDGQTDLVFYTSVKGNNNMTYYLANADGKTFTNGGTITGTTTLLGEPRGIIVTDFDGDGLSDIILKYKWVGDESIDPKSTGFKFYRSTGTTFSLVNSVWAGNNASEEFAGDFDNDGKKELFYRAIDWEGFYNYYLLRPNSLPIVLRNEVPGDEDIVVADFTGEGQSDVLILNSTGYSINEVIGNVLVQKSRGSQVSSSGGIISFGDFNGDGKADILKSGLVPYFYLSNGNTFENVNPWDDILSINLIKPVVKDFNGDGKDDILDITSSTEARLFINSGTYISNIYRLTSSASLSGSADSYNDFNGDGLPDYYNESRMICFNENDNRFKVTTILDGFNRKTSFAYKSIVDPSVYTKGAGAMYPVTDFQSPLKVVESITSEAGYGQLVTTRYTYQGAKKHALGRGFLGFSGVTSLNTTSNIKTVSNNYLNTANYIMLPESSRTYSGNTLISEQIDTMEIRDFGSKRLFIYRKSSTSRSYDLNTQALYANYYERYNYDDYGNPVLIESNTGGVVFGKIENTWINSGGYCLNRISNSKTTTSRSGETPYVSITEFTYNNGILNRSIAEPGDAQKVITDYQYNFSGNVTNMKVSNNGTGGRSENMEYDVYGRFLTKKSNAYQHFTQTTYDERFGVPIEVKDHNNITTSHTYDGFGRLTQTTAPDGNISKVTLYWVTGSGPQYALYYSKTETPGNPPVYVYYDKLGRELRSQKTSLNGTQVYSDVHYDAKGQVDQVTLPYFTGATSFNYKTMAYDNLGRITSETAPGVNTTYSYNGLSATITDNIAAQTYTRTADATGSLVSATDQGGTIGYSYYSSGLVKTISAPGKTISMTYDQFGRQTQLTDPDAGTYRYGYNVYGELISQTDPQQRTTYLDYNNIGQLTSQTGGTFNINYTYKTNGWLDNVSSSNNVNYTLAYDGLGRVTGKTENINGAEIITNYGYNPIGQLSQVSYANSGLSVNYNYQNGYLKEVRRGDNNALIWNLNSVNEKDQITQTSFGNGLVTNRGYHTIGYLTSINTGNGSIQNLEYHYNGKGLMDWRKDNRRGLTESFGYDALNRLNLIQVNGTTTQEIQYSAAGNIQSKTGVGNYTYGGSQPNALTQVSNLQMLVSTDAQNITYTTFDKVSQITEAANSASITYGPDYQRKMMTTLINGASSTKYYSDAYEREIKNGVTRHMHYVVAYNDIVAIFEKKSTDTNPVMHYVHTDHLGSLNVITSQSGSIEQEMSFDAWGNRRDPNTWQNLTSAPTNLVTDRGFTGHEHMDGFKLINMNGRVYDPVLGRFLSADKIIQNPVGTQSYNRYSYCVNNPLMFTDPSGYTYFKYKDGEWSSFEYDPFGGTTSYDFRTASGGFEQPMYNHLGGGVYTNRDGYRVSFDEVNNNYLARDLKGTLSGEGSLEAAKAILNGFDLYEVSAYGRTTHVLTPGGKQYGIDHFLNSLEGYSSSNVPSVGGTTIYDLVIGDVDGVYAVAQAGGGDWFDKVQTGRKHGWNWSSETIKARMSHLQTREFIYSMEDIHKKINTTASRATWSSGIAISILTKNPILGITTATFGQAVQEMSGSIADAFNVLGRAYNAMDMPTGLCVITYTSRITTMGTGMYTSATTSTFYLPTGELFLQIRY